MGMYHFVFSLDRRVRMYADKTLVVDKPADIHLKYRKHWAWKTTNIRSGLILQSMLRQAGCHDQHWKLFPHWSTRKGITPYKRRYPKRILFAGHTYLRRDVLEQFRPINPGFADLLLWLLDHYPGRWYLYGDDMCEPHPYMAESPDVYVLKKKPPRNGYIPRSMPD